MPVSSRVHTSESVSMTYQKPWHNDPLNQGPPWVPGQQRRRMQDVYLRWLLFASRRTWNSTFIHGKVHSMSPVYLRPVPVVCGSDIPTLCLLASCFALCPVCCFAHVEGARALLLQSQPSVRASEKNTDSTKISDESVLVMVLGAAEAADSGSVPSVPNATGRSSSNIR